MRRANKRRRSAANSQRARVREALIAIAVDPKQGGRKLAGLEPSELASVLEAGAAQGLGTALVASLRAGRISVPIWLEAHRFDMAVRRDRILATLAVIAPALTAAEVPWVVLKGPVIAATYESSEQREYSDLDILAPGRYARDALDVLRQTGVEVFNRNWGEYVRYGVAEFPLFLGGTAIDLHWHLIGLAAKRKRFDISIEEMLERSQPTTLQGISCNRLDSEDNAIHVALHAGLSGACRLGWLRDIDRIVRAVDLDWRVLASRARGYRAAPIVGHVLDRCAHVMGTPVPVDLPGSLAPPQALHARRWLDQRLVLRGRSPEYAYHGFSVEVSRAGMIPTLGRTRELVRERLVEAVSEAPGWSAYDPEGPLYWDRSTGGADGLERYLEYADRHG